MIVGGTSGVSGEKHFCVSRLLCIRGLLIPYFDTDHQLWSVSTVQALHWLNQSPQVASGFSFASTLRPHIGEYGHYNAAYSTADPSAAFYLLSMVFFSFMFAICIPRTYACLVIVDWSLTIVFCLLAPTFWDLAQGASRLLRVNVFCKFAFPPNDV